MSIIELRETDQVEKKPMQGAQVIKLAQQWLGTPYHHQQSLKGVGCDCLGLVRGVYGELYGKNTASITPYSRDWAEASGEETLIIAAREHLIEIEKSAHAPGDVLIFRFRKWMVAKHAAIETQGGRMIHAIEQAPVSEVRLSPWWQRHIAAVFRFPPKEYKN